MKIYKIKLNTCKFCPNVYIDPYFSTKDKCYGVQPPKKLNIKKIPKWCPLEDYKK